MAGPMLICRYRHRSSSPCLPVSVAHRLKIRIFSPCATHTDRRIVSTYTSIRSHCPQGRLQELQTFRTQDLSSPRMKGPYRELSFLRNESARELSFPGRFFLGNFCCRGTKVPGTFVPRTFRSLELSFP